LEPLELGYKSQRPRALTLSPFAAAAGGTTPHRVKPREREEEEARRRKEAAAEPDLAGARSAAPIGYSDVAARHGTASPH